MEVVSVYPTTIEQIIFTLPIAHNVVLYEYNKIGVQVGSGQPGNNKQPHPNSMFKNSIYLFKTLYFWFIEASTNN